MMQLFDTAIEAICDYVHSHESIGRPAPKRCSTIPTAPNKPHSAPIPREKHSTSSSLSHESSHRFCYKQPFVAAHATSDSFEAAPKRTIPEPRKHNIHRFGIYSSKVRAYRAKNNLTLSTFTNEGSSPEPIDSTLSPQKRAALRKRWAHLIRRVYLTDPLICPDCGGELRVIAFITEPKIIGKFLRHLRNRKNPSRAPPAPQPQPAFAFS